MRTILISAILICILSSVSVTAERTPPVMPKIQETPLPPAVELPPPPAPAADVPNRALTAEETVWIALLRQPSIAIAGAGVEAAQGRLRSTRSGLLPALNLTAAHNNVSISQTGATSFFGGSSDGYQVSATVRQLLFDFDHTRDLVQQARAQRSSAAANLTRAESDLILQTKQAFYTYVQNERLVKVNEENVRSRQGHLALAQARLESGLGPPVDVVRAETAVADAIFSLTLARANSSVARVGLAELMGMDPRTPLQAADSTEPGITADDPNALIAQALRQRPEMVQGQAALEAAEHGLSAAHTGNSPALGASVGSLQRGSSLSLDNRSLTVGVSLQWFPFDAGLTSGRVTEAQANRQAAERQLELTRLAVITDVSEAYISLKTAEQRVVTADAQVANAREALRLSEGRYRSGLGTFIEVLDAQAALVNADTNRVNAQSAVNVSRAALSHALGLGRGNG